MTFCRFKSCTYTQLHLPNDFMNKWSFAHFYELDSHMKSSFGYWFHSILQHRSGKYVGELGMKTLCPSGEVECRQVTYQNTMAASISLSAATVIYICASAVNTHSLYAIYFLYSTESSSISLPSFSKTEEINTSK